MRICVFSDIHGNEYAMQAALPCLQREAADRYIFLGDLVGYYWGALDVWEMLLELPQFVGVAGNHDRDFVGFYEAGYIPSEYTMKYGPALELLLDCGDDRLKLLYEFIKRLPEQYEDSDAGLLCCHGSPSAPLTGYVYPDSELPSGATLPPFVFLGHTHYPMCRLNDGVMFCNPGSLGQPRKGGMPTYAVVDSDLRSFTLRYVEYDKTALLAGLKSQPCPDYLTDVLERHPL
jgi:predicted phosphodiesterase